MLEHVLKCSSFPPPGRMPGGTPQWLGNAHNQDGPLGYRAMQVVSAHISVMCMSCNAHARAHSACMPCVLRMGASICWQYISRSC